MSKEQSPILSYFRNHSKLGGAIGIIVVVVVLLVGVVVPTYNKMGSVKATLAKKEEDLAELSNKVVILQSLDEDVLQERVELIDGILPPNKDVISYLATVDGLTRDLGLVWGGISLAPGEIYESTESAEKSNKKVSERTKELNSLETELKIVGLEDDIYTLLKEIEGTSPLMQVRDVKMVRVGETSSFTLTLSLAMIYSKPVDSTLKGVVSLLDSDERELFDEILTYKTYTIPGFDTDEGYVIEKKLNLFESITTAQDLDLPVQEPVQGFLE